MTPADILAAARLSPLSPVVPAREEWIQGWRGPVLLAGQRATVFWTSSDGRRVGVITDELREESTYMVGLLSLALDLPEVRDRLVRCGAPEWCRESVAGMLAWALSGATQGAASWTEDNPGMWWRHPAARGAGATLHSGPTGWAGMALEHSPGHLAHGPETGPEGRAACDLDSLSRGCVLTEPDGWYIPLPGGAVGWLPKESA